MNDPASFVLSALEKLGREIPGRAIAASSGGIDSSVAVLLARRALGERLRAIFVDTGLLRAGEVDRVRAFHAANGIPLEVLSASERFFSTLKGVADPEEKRRRIGAAFIRLFEQEADRFHTEVLIQGTIAPDWIESGGSARETIKSHHNVGGIPKDSRLQLVEPLRELYKDEVRAVARHLNVPEPDRQPFPGPGMAVRVVGPVTPERVRRAQIANRIVEEEIDRAVGANRMGRPWQYFAVLLPVQSVGVTGDNRVYGEAVSVRLVESTDAMTAVAAELPRDVGKKIAERITRELTGEVVRVLYDLTDKPPATIEWE